jgi:hypothetical protein
MCISLHISGNKLEIQRQMNFWIEIIIQLSEYICNREKQIFLKQEEGLPASRRHPERSEGSWGKTLVLPMLLNISRQEGGGALSAYCMLPESMQP